ncbi:MAG: Gfo/Idh/MocA family oxidoreductase [Sedimentisphaerales bacterium]|nr:Gfo/Idh/MocA family oxidoreductase [Sedimentisphaerales bacterium]
MKTKPEKITRRSFLKSATVSVAAPYFVPASVLGKNSVAPSNRITLGLIGLGSMGMRHVKGFLQEQDCRIIAVCDVDTARRNEAVKEVNTHYGNQDCAQYNDFRNLIERQDVDTLCIAVPDHWHSIPAMMGIRAGKDVYGEKPLALTIAQGRLMCETVQRYRCVWQTGSWQRSTAHFRRVCELVRNGRIGKLQRVEVGIGEGFRPMGSRGPIYQIEPQPVMPVPEGFDYERWLGPAPQKPYTEKRCHWNFRWILDYSGGQVTDWGAHHIDIAHWGMGVDDTGPVQVEGVGRFPEDGLWDAAVQYKFQCDYAHGVSMEVGSNNYLKQGVRFIGEQGWVHVTRSSVDASPKDVLKEKIGPEEIHLARPAGDERQGHRRDFLDCVKTRAQTITPVEIGHRSVSVCHLGNIAMILGRKIRWDPKQEKIIDDPMANSMLSRATRSPW